MSDRVRTATGAKVLAVDDDEELLGLLDVILRREGFRVLLASNGESALAKVDAEGPDVILLDLMMPRMDGYTVLRRLRRRVRSPRVVCLTAKTDPMSREKAWRLGIDEYLTKPFGVTHLVAAVDGVVDRRWPERRARRRAALRGLGDAV